MLRHAWDSVRPGRWCDALALLADAAPSAGVNPSYAADLDVPRAAATAGVGTPGRTSGTALPLVDDFWSGPVLCCVFDVLFGRSDVVFGPSLPCGGRSYV
ncbi:hypothetical protein GCM10010222_05030 [Streptomyces tanashiensis]|nr:hypothetical protein GCM10010222_05030 [Streptomyces tanashiensis]